MNETKQATMPQNDWKVFFQSECRKPYFSKLNKTLGAEYASRQIYPPQDSVFRAFELTPYSDVKAVILGQDPYHEPGQAMGMAFSVPVGTPLPPSLVNIYKELQDDLGILPASHGDLTDWAKQGVLLLNTTLTVRRGAAHSHKGLGWETFTDAVISYIEEKDDPVVYLLWGRPAQEKERLLNNRHHWILKAPHPSPLSAYRGFFGCRHFSYANAFLTEHGKQAINWEIGGRKA